MAKARVGISGWTYPGWRGDFYPEGLAHRKELAYAAGRLTTIEINGSFYALQKPASYAKWHDETPDDFVFAVKGSRYITHMKRLADVEAALPNFFASGVLALGPKLGPFLWQLPPTLEFDEARVSRFLERLPRTTDVLARLAREHDDKLRDGSALTECDASRPVRHAVEVRHRSFDSPEAVELLRAHDVAFVVADTAGRYPLVKTPTSDFVYVRLHGDAELYASGYSDDALDRWADDIRAWTDSGLDVFVYFDNDVKGYAPFDAQRMSARLA
ncbi:hypothetical protein BFN03_19900 [Rhodococcus sp. WMMA185]|uniref:DUF72 domain-containing protein n=1 Tax=Rhodococcus sp. WMMA185 TaxID=679318 RepID=UPI0008780BFE|nr:DUF72 domain-containing protein [Rhodococcus sp. WMMA185]AOW91596.1 hypothetical protein BFN03_00020 [Rhodococcus sp. WMMA185]AOW94186.1 hypothetical protein BFN03_19900 [Rhodococcus sp. WMMA185]